MANDDALAPAPILPIRIGTVRPSLRVTYVCQTLEWAGQKLRDFRAAGDKVVMARDATGRALTRGERAALPGPYDVVAAAA